MIYEVKVGVKKYRLELKPPGTEVRVDNDKWRCRMDEDGPELEIDTARIGANTLSLIVGGKAYTVRREGGQNDLRIWIGENCWTVELQDPRSWRSRKKLSGIEDGPAKLLASMPGKVVRVLVAEGDAVHAGGGVLVVEAMKMQNEIKSPRAGVAQKILVSEGANVNAGDTLAIIE
ncbi:MAG: hypothetical protein QOD84_1943 [Acidobacteriaceae bacterium]|jgi:biotin carboxyl carrier protein